MTAAGRLQNTSIPAYHIHHGLITLLLQTSSPIQSIIQLRSHFKDYNYWACHACHTIRNCTPMQRRAAQHIGSTPACLVWSGWPCFTLPCIALLALLLFLFFVLCLLFFPFFCFPTYLSVSSLCLSLCVWVCACPSSYSLHTQLPSTYLMPPTSFPSPHLTSLLHHAELLFLEEFKRRSTVTATGCSP